MTQLIKCYILTMFRDKPYSFELRKNKYLMIPVLYFLILFPYFIWKMVKFS